MFEAQRRMQRESDGSQDEEEFDEKDYEAAMEEAMDFFMFMCAHLLQSAWMHQPPIIVRA